MLAPVSKGLRLVGALLGLGVVACGGPSVADIAQQRVMLTVRGVASDPDVAAIGEPAAGLGVTRAWLRTRAVTFAACRADTEALTLAPRDYELLNDAAPSEEITTAVDELCGLHVEVGASGEAGDGSSKDTTLHVEGTDADGNAFTLESDGTASLDFETDAEASFGEQPLLLGVDVSKWLADVPLTEDEAEAASEQLLSRLKSAVALYVDRDGDGKLDDDEQTPIATSEP
jgi:hypothetical protein